MLGLLVFAATPEPVAAYVGPGAGFVFVTSFLVFAVSLLIALFSVLLWPFRAALRFIRYAHLPKPKVRRLIIVGFDDMNSSIVFASIIVLAAMSLGMFGILVWLEKVLMPWRQGIQITEM